MISIATKETKTDEQRIKGAVQPATQNTKSAIIFCHRGTVTGRADIHAQRGVCA